MPNLGNVRAWTTALRKPGLRQVRQKLAAHVGENGLPSSDEAQPIGQCCLGLGCDIAGIPRTPTRSFIYTQDDEDEDLPYEYEAEVWAYGDAEAEDLPPQEFFDWLGLPVDHYHGGLFASGGEDVYLDVPYALRPRTRERQVAGAPRIAASALNDEWRLTFPQIADMIDYFGLRPRELKS
jgi:hypothetical protein